MSAARPALSYTVNNEVVFVHNQPKLRNIGDDLCSPKHYFCLTTRRDRVVVLGGGAFADYGASMLSDYGLPPSEAVAWGIGRSLVQQFDAPEKISDLPYLAWALRDADGVSDLEHFVPCVSCMHPMLDDPVDGSATLLFLNAAPHVTPRRDVRKLQAYARNEGWEYLDNTCSDMQMRLALRRSRRVVTNSFHGAYWALLSGRQVKLLGYSSKFSSLLRTLGLPPSALAPYRRPARGGPWSRLFNGSDLLQQLHRSIESSGFLQLGNAADLLSQFRAINLRFASALVDRQILSAAVPRLRTGE